MIKMWVIRYSTARPRRRWAVAAPAAAAAAAAAERGSSVPETQEQHLQPLLEFLLRGRIRPKTYFSAGPPDFTANFKVPFFDLCPRPQGKD